MFQIYTKQCEGQIVEDRAGSEEGRERESWFASITPLSPRILRHGNAQAGGGFRLISPANFRTTGFVEK